MKKMLVLMALSLLPLATYAQFKPGKITVPPQLTAAIERSIGSRTNYAGMLAELTRSTLAQEFGEITARELTRDIEITGHSLEEDNALDMLARASWKDDELNNFVTTGALHDIAMEDVYGKTTGEKIFALAPGQTRSYQKPPYVVALRNLYVRDYVNSGFRTFFVKEGTQLRLDKTLDGKGLTWHHTWKDKVNMYRLKQHRQQIPDTKELRKRLQRPFTGRQTTLTDIDMFNLPFSKHANKFFDLPLLVNYNGKVGVIVPIKRYPLVERGEKYEEPSFLTIYENGRGKLHSTIYSFKLAREVVDVSFNLFEMEKLIVADQKKTISKGFNVKLFVKQKRENGSALYVPRYRMLYTVGEQVFVVGPTDAFAIHEAEIDNDGYVRTPESVELVTDAMPYDDYVKSLLNMEKEEIPLEKLPLLQPEIIATQRQSEPQLETTSNVTQIGEVKPKGSLGDAEVPTQVPQGIEAAWVDSEAAVFYLKNDHSINRQRFIVWPVVESFTLPDGTRANKGDYIQDRKGRIIVYPGALFRSKYVRVF